MTEATAVENVVETATPRVPTTETIRGGYVVAVANEFDPNNSALDVPMYFDSFYNGSDRQRFNGYLLRDSDGEAETWVTEISSSRLMSVISTDHYSYKQEHKWRTAAGKFVVVSPSYLPQEFRDSLTVKGQKMPRYKTYFEVMAVQDKVVTARVFTNESLTPEAVEFGTVEIPEAAALNIMQNCTLFTREEFERRYGLAAVAYPVGSVHTYESKTWEVQSIAGDVATFLEVDDDTAEVVAGATPMRLSTEYTKYTVKVADSLAAMKAAMPSGEALEALNLLSRNTVTRALKHADSNNYCSETAVALTSAGHVMPEVKITGTITIPINVSSKEYMLLRRLFGLANSDVSNMDAVLKQNYSAIAENVRELPKVGKLPAGAVMDLQTEVIWKTPKLRPLA